MSPPASLGNLALGRLIQAKLSIGAAGDRYEQEADRVAGQVTRTSGAGASAANVPAPSAPPQIQRLCTECEEEVQRQPDSPDHSANEPRSTESSVQTLRYGGEPLSPSTRARFEPRFGRDFSNVRIHTGAAAESSARDLNALAYTVGSDIAFAAGRYSPETPSGQRLLAHELTHVVQQGHAGAAAPAVVQRQADPERENAPAAPQPETRQGTQSAWIVDDDALQIGPGQMRKSEFLSRMKTEVCRESEDAMKDTGRTTDGCPYVEKWFGYYAEKDSRYVERSLRKYAPEAAGAASAGDYIPIVAARVRRSVEVWARTGEITGVPDELAGAVMGGEILGAIGSAVSAIGSAIGSVVSGIGRAFSAIGSLFFKPRDGASAAPRDSGSVAGALGNGRGLDAPVRQRMETAFSRDFSGVRVHTDSRAAGLSSGMNARAFTVGQQVAFGPGEYRPGTLVGDALIAHELAHVVQQSAAAPGERVLQKGEPSGALEEDADISAVRAVVSTWGAGRKLGAMADRAMPSLRSGLRLQRCSRNLVPGPNFEKCSPDQQTAVNEAFTLGRSWVTYALGKLDAMLAGQDDPDTLQQLRVHFHIKDATEDREVIVKVRQGLATLQAAFTGPVPFECEASGSSTRTDEGGCLEGGIPISNVPGVFGWRGDIHFYSDFFVNSTVAPFPEFDTPAQLKEKALKERAAIIIHEMAHKFLKVGDQQYYKGCKSREYAALSAKDSLDNADSYAQFTRYVQINK